LRIFDLGLQPATIQNREIQNLESNIKDWLNAGLAFFYPEVCQLCEKERATPQDGFVCSECRGQVRLIRRPFCERCGRPVEGAITNIFECSNCRELELHFSSARSAVLARDTALEAIHRYKYNRAMWFEPFLAGLLIAEAVPALALQSWDAIVPVPLHPTKEREREFNQAARLAARLAKATSIPMNQRLLERVKPTPTQTHLTREERAANVRSAFALRKELNLQGQRFVVVDDVFTTGATTSACARALRKAGAVEVCVWTVARGI